MRVYQLRCLCRARKEEAWLKTQSALIDDLWGPSLGDEGPGVYAGSTSQREERPTASLSTYRESQAESFDQFMSNLYCDSDKRQAPKVALKLFRRALRRGGYPDDVKICDCGRPFLKEYIIEHQQEL